MVTPQILAPYLTHQQVALLTYDEALPPALLDELSTRLRAELAALQTFVPPPAYVGADLAAGAYYPGSLLCADLSGFTALTEQLATRGRQGVEELSAIINMLFGALLEEIAAYGGTVLKFSGDAVSVLFAEAQLGSRHAALACAAALALQERVRAFEQIETSCGRWAVRLRVGVHSGRIFLATLGDTSRRELLVAGRDVNRANVVQERALPGEVLLSNTTRVGLERLHALPRPDGLLRLLEPPLVARPVLAPAMAAPRREADLPTALELASRIATLRSFLPQGLPRRFLEDANGGYSGEFRPVTALFANIFSFGDLLAQLAGSEHLAVRALNVYYTRAQQVIHSYDGSINKLDVASFGERLIALFGAPRAHEDDPRRAVQAALDLSTAIRDANTEIAELLGRGDGGLGTGDWGTNSIGMIQDIATSPNPRSPIPDPRSQIPNPHSPLPNPLRQRIGLATGTVFVGLVGGPQRREYTAVGQMMNLAARLMSAGEEGQTLLAPATWRAVAPHIAIQHLPPLTLKGIPEPVPAALALRSLEISPGPTLTQVTPLVGRGEELGLLLGLLHETVRGSGRVVALSGEAGMGKSRLAHELLRDKAARPLRVVAVSCRSYATTLPYSLVRDLLEQAFDLPAASDPQELRAAIRQAIATYAPAFATLAPLLYGLAGVGRADDEPLQDEIAPATRSRRSSYRLVVDERRTFDPIGSLPPAERRARLHELLEVLFEGLAAERPLLLLLDDLHWADPSSLEVVQQLTRLVRDTPLLLLLVYRPEPDFAEPWLSHPQVAALRLEPLDRARSEALLTNLLDGPPPDELLPLLDRAQGSPFFLESLLHHLVETGELVRNERGDWRLRHALDALSLPLDIERLVIARLDRLEEPTRALVEVAAVIGSSVTYAVLAGVYSQAQQLAQRLTYLVHTGILQIDERDEEEPFRFRHTLLREVAYNSILYTSRRELHRRVVDRMELLAEGRGTPPLAELAHHSLLAESWGRACSYTLQLGALAQSRYAITEALASYRRAYQLATDHPDEISLSDRHTALEGLADVEVVAGWHEQAHQHYRALLAELGDGQFALAATLRRKIGGVYEHQGQFDEALAWMEQARQQLLRAERRSQLELARIASAIGWVYFRRGELQAAQEWLGQALGQLDHTNLANAPCDEERRGVATERARVQNRLGGLAWSRGDLPAARGYVEGSLAIWQELGDLLGQADARNNLGVLADQFGLWDEAIEHYNGALQIDRQIGRRREAALSLLNLGIASFHQGNLRAALEHLQQAIDQTAEVDDTLHQAMALRWLGRALTAQGAYEEARSALHHALALTEPQECWLECLDAYAALGELALAAGHHADTASAHAAGQSLLPRVEQLSPETAYFLRFAAQLAQQQGDEDEANRLFDQCRAIFTELDMRAEVALTQALHDTPLAHARGR